MKKILPLVLFMLIPSRSLFAQDSASSNVPVDKDTIVVLARAMVSEANWSQIDHAAIAWALKRQWLARKRVKPNWTFRQQILAYCVGLKGRIRTKRQRWVRNLRADPKMPPYGWPSSVAWTRYRDKWAYVLQYAQDWAEGKINDPCRGRSFHWGAAHKDIFFRVKKSGWRRVHCGPTQNLFWSIGSV